MDRSPTLPEIQLETKLLLEQRLAEGARTFARLEEQMHTLQTEVVDLRRSVGRLMIAVAFLSASAGGGVGAAIVKLFG